MSILRPTKPTEQKAPSCLRRFNPNTIKLLLSTPIVSFRTLILIGLKILKAKEVKAIEFVGVEHIVNLHAFSTAGTENELQLRNSAWFFKPGLKSQAIWDLSNLDTRNKSPWLSQCSSALSRYSSPLESNRWGIQFFSPLYLRSVDFVNMQFFMCSIKSNQCLHT